MKARNLSDAFGYIRLSAFEYFQGFFGMQPQTFYQT
jgi:hypothetical protein